jgi:hypothetical protein
MRVMFQQSQTNNKPRSPMAESRGNCKTIIAQDPTIDGTIRNDRFMTISMDGSCDIRMIGKTIYFSPFCRPTQLAITYK